MQEYIDALIKSALQGRTPREFVIKYLKMFGVLLLVFYYTYPQAIGVSIGGFNSSFIVPAAACGLLLYAWNRFPFAEVPKVIMFFLALLGWCYLVDSMNYRFEGFRIMYIRSQMGWFFSAYLINFALFNVHKKPKFEVIVGYIAATVILQSIITFAMNQNEWANEFFYSLQMQGGDFDQETKEIIEEQRLMGYGTALFGAGLVAGYGLIFIVYLMSKIKLTKIQFSALAIAYCFVFFIGLFSARTTSIGLAASIGFLFVLYFIDPTTEKKQPLRFMGISVILFFFGAGLAAIYFPDYSEWAFEMFENFKKTGKFSTDSSDALYVLFSIPYSFWDILLGTGRWTFWGNDMGYSRLIWYIGYIGTGLYFGYQIYIARLMITKDISANLLIVMVVTYSLVMNVKGFTDMNPTLYLLFFFFLFYKYYRYYPDLYMQRIKDNQKRLEKEQLKQAAKDE